jgi:hypothetical protein
MQLNSGADISVATPRGQTAVAWITDKKVQQSFDDMDRRRTQMAQCIFVYGLSSTIGVQSPVHTVFATSHDVSPLLYIDL